MFCLLNIFLISTVCVLLLQEENAMVEKACNLEYKCQNLIGFWRMGRKGEMKMKKTNR